MCGTAASEAAAIMPPARIALSWVVRLRWLAVAGQIAAIALVAAMVELAAPLWLLGIPIGVTALTNLALVQWMRRVEPPPWAPPALFLVDIALLTWLLAATGGTANPFCVLYLVHVAMAAAVLGPRWTWALAGASAGCVGVLALAGRPLTLDGQVPTAVAEIGQVTALLLAAGLMAYFVARVSHSLRQREQDLSEARRQAERDHRVASLATLAAGAAHEMGTPLATIAVVARELEVGGLPADALVEDARLIRREVDRCRGILDRLRLDVPAEQAARPHKLQASSLIESLLEALEPGEGPQLRAMVAPGAETLVVPERGVQQVIGVLLRNAFDASADGEAVDLRIGRRDGQVRFEVEDHGPGMSQATLAHAGEPFFTTKPPGEGMGLGLFLARMVADRHGGSLRLESREGGGTTAVFCLPEPQQEAAP